MSKLVDVGLGKSKAEAKVARLAAYKRPKTKVTRDKRRKERIDAAKEAYGIATDIQG